MTSAPIPALATSVSWEGVCIALGIPFHTKALPLRTRCPLCGQESLDIFNDNTSGGQWHNCQACGSSGDMIELASKTWDISIDATVHRLAGEGALTCDAPDSMAIARYANAFPDYRQRVLRMWNAARLHLPQSKSMDIAKIRHKYGLRLNVSPDRWTAGPGHMLGCLPKDQIETALHPHLLGGTQDATRVFKKKTGTKWKEVLMMPYYDLPNRIRAFSFIGRQGIVPDDQLFRLTFLRTSQGSTTGKREAGLGGMESVHLATGSNAVIAVDNWLLALQIQMRTFRTSMRPMPMVVWHDDGQNVTQQAWDMLYGKRVVFWAPFVDHRVVRQAVEIDGEISYVGPVKPDRKVMQNYLPQKTPADLARLVLQHAKPWDKMLKEWLDQHALEGEAAALWHNLEANGADISYIWRRLGTGAPTKVQVKRSVMLGTRKIVEQNDCWYVQQKKDRRELYNATFKLTHAIKDRTNSELFYYGAIRFKGNAYSFIERADTIQDDTSKWLKKKLIDLNAGVFYCPFETRRNKGDLLSIAILFHEPEFVVDDLYKWVEKLRSESKQVDGGAFV